MWTARSQSRSIPFTMAYPGKTSPEAIRAAAIGLLEREGGAALTLRRVAGVLANRWLRSRWLPAGSQMARPGLAFPSINVFLLEA